VRLPNDGCLSLPDYLAVNEMTRDIHSAVVLGPCNAYRIDKHNRITIQSFGLVNSSTIEVQ